MQKNKKNKTTANIRFFHSDSNSYNWKIARGIDHWNGLHSAFRQLFHLEAAKQNSAFHPLQLASQNRSLCLSETTLVALQLEMKHNNLGLWPNQSTKLHQKLVNFQKGDSLVSLDLQCRSQPAWRSGPIFIFVLWLASGGGVWFIQKLQNN